MVRRASVDSGEAHAHARRDLPQVFILTRTVASRELVAHRCARAAEAGVTTGMDLAHARSLLPSRLNAHVEPHRPERDAMALHALAVRLCKFSPLVAPDPPDGLVLDITGVAHLFGGELLLLRQIARFLHSRGFVARISAASTIGCAWAMARHADQAFSSVLPGGERDALTRLPTCALRIDDTLSHALAEIGITTIGDVLRLPPASLAARFDPALLRRLSQALGRAPETIEPVRPRPPARAGLMFDGHTDAWEAVHEAARTLLHELCDVLAEQERGVRQLDVTLQRPKPATNPHAGVEASDLARHAVPPDVQIMLSHPNRSAAHLWSLLRPRLERIDLAGGVEGVVLSASRTGRLRHEQQVSDGLGGQEPTFNKAAWGELIDTLSSRLGIDRVVYKESVASHLPERTVRVCPAVRGVAISTRHERPTPRVQQDAVPRGDRPTRLFARPERVEVLAVAPDGPLASVAWRGRRWSVLHCAGPERLEQEWWRWQPLTDTKKPSRTKTSKPTPRQIQIAPPARDYFRVQLENGHWVWMFRHINADGASLCWFVHGVWA